MFRNKEKFNDFDFLNREIDNKEDGIDSEVEQHLADRDDIQAVVADQRMDRSTAPYNASSNMNNKSPMNHYYSSGARPARPVTSDYGYGGSNNALDNKINSFDELQGIYLVRKPSRPVQAFATNSTAPPQPNENSSINTTDSKAMKISRWQANTSGAAYAVNISQADTINITGRHSIDNDRDLDRCSQMSDATSLTSDCTDNTILTNTTLTSTNYPVAVTNMDNNTRQVSVAKEINVNDKTTAGKHRSSSSDASHASDVTDTAASISTLENTPPRTALRAKDSTDNSTNTSTTLFRESSVKQQAAEASLEIELATGVSLVDDTTTSNASTIDNNISTAISHITGEVETANETAISIIESAIDDAIASSENIKVQTSSITMPHLKQITDEPSIAISSSSKSAGDVVPGEQSPFMTLTKDDTAADMNNSMKGAQRQQSEEETEFVPFDADPASLSTEQLMQIASLRKKLFSMDIDRALAERGIESEWVMSSPLHNSTNMSNKTSAAHTTKPVMQNMTGKYRNSIGNGNATKKSGRASRYNVSTGTLNSHLAFGGGLRGYGEEPSESRAVGALMMSEKMFSSASKSLYQNMTSGIGSRNYNLPPNFGISLPQQLHYISSNDSVSSMPMKMTSFNSSNSSVSSSMSNHSTSRLYAPTTSSYIRSQAHKHFRTTMIREKDIYGRRINKGAASNLRASYSGPVSGMNGNTNTTSHGNTNTSNTTTATSTQAANQNTRRSGPHTKRHSKGDIEYTPQDWTNTADTAHNYTAQSSKREKRDSKEALFQTTEIDMDKYRQESNLNLTPLDVTLLQARTEMTSPFTVSPRTAFDDRSVSSQGSQRSQISTISTSHHSHSSRTSTANMVSSPSTSQKLRKSESLDKGGKVRYGGDLAPPTKSNHTKQQEMMKTSKVENKSTTATTHEKTSGFVKVESSSSFEEEMKSINDNEVGNSSSSSVERDAVTPNLQRHFGVVSVTPVSGDSRSINTINGEVPRHEDMPRSFSVSSALTSSTFEHIDINESMHGSNASLSTLETLNDVERNKDVAENGANSQEPISAVSDAKDRDKESVVMRSPIEMSDKTARRVNSTSTLTDALKAGSVCSTKSSENGDTSVSIIGDVVATNGSITTDSVVTVGGNNGAFSSTNNSKIVVAHSSDDMDDHTKPLVTGHSTTISGHKKKPTKSKPIAIKAGNTETRNRSSSSSAPADISISIEETSGEVASIMAHVRDSALLEESTASGKSNKSRDSDDYDYFDALLGASDVDEDASETDSVVIEGDTRGESTIMDGGVGRMDMGFDANGSAIGSLTNSLELESWMLNAGQDSNVVQNMR